MKINIKSKNGLSLTELIVASVLIGIIMIGVISFTLSIKQIQRTTSRSTVPSVRLSSVMFEIAQDGALATGDATDTGITWDDVGPDRVLCFRQDTDDTPDNYANDVLVCYLIDGNNIICKKVTDNTGAILSAFPNLITITQNDFFDVITDVDGKIKYIEVFLTTSNDPSAGPHPIDNPEFTLETRISPMSLGR